MLPRLRTDKIEVDNLTTLQLAYLLEASSMSLSYSRQGRPGLTHMPLLLKFRHLNIWMCRFAQLCITGKGAAHGPDALTMVLQPQKAMEVRMEEPALSTSQPPTRVAITAVTMVAAPKTRSICSSAVPNMAEPACSHRGALPLSAPLPWARAC